MFRLERIDHVALTVRDVDRSVAWYQDILGLERQFEEVWGSFPAVVGTGQGALALFPVQGENPNHPPGADTLCFRHVAFRLDRRSFDEARRALSEMGVEFEFQDHEIAHSIYLRDPDGHQIELTTYDLPD